MSENEKVKEIKKISVELILPKEEYLDSCVKAGEELYSLNIKTFGLYDPDVMDVDPWKKTILKFYEMARQGVNLPSGHVPSSTFWLVEDGEFVGIGNVRHRLTDALLRFGGHIGYAIRPTKWNQGYGTLLLKFLLKEAARLGIEEVLLTCDKANIASAEVMKKNGAIFLDAFEDVIDGKPRTTCRYTIAVDIQ
ncbi:MAG: GNAT family N-acetyltransferase [Synergistaceae bacterium]|jgi:predicted acetyltransferase|nr:GNAT family N-acetyltransferase [Synergistaceae bacterium]